MTDLEATELFFKRLKIDFILYKEEDKVIRRNRTEINTSYRLAIGCGDGYAFFEGYFYFDIDGKFLTHALTE